MGGEEVKARSRDWLPRVEFHPGDVVIAGAGPGDMGHVTLLAMSYLRRADVVVYDRLTDHSIFRFVKEGTELIYAGKGPRRAVQQEKINDILLERARRGRRVLRWKGGDPYVYGRGYDERTHLMRNGIRVTCIPGVSSVTGLPTLAGIPVLHRGTASTVGIFTGELGSGNSTRSMKLDRLARANDTLVGVMVVKNLDRILSEIEKVRGPEEPAALIIKGATEMQTVLRSTVGGLGRESRKRRVSSPAILVVGPVVNLR